ncbi:MAG: YfiR family protein, partial [Thermodesulfobacteriota bacterium]|nr:YfiR family protein [Thermodesulfobacteriota bacterium]
VKNRVRFEINIDKAEKAGLKISSKLLKLAKIVENKREQEEK